MYFGNLYDQYIKSNKLNIYGKKLQKIPTPEYIVFYNGEDNCEAVTKLRLSDAFINKDGSGEFEWTATVYNLNRGKNEELFRKCRSLSEYMELVNRIRENQKKGMSIRESIDIAIESCIADGVMKEFLIKHRAEVLSVCITEFDEKVYTDGIREEGREEGRREGLKEGHREGLKEGHREGLEEGLKILVGNLKEFLPDFESLYAAVVKNEEYKDVTREQIKKYYNR